ncbi:MAG: ABC transporter ATP-binding protein [Halobacteria archaeon]|nr:ABC transporter ATP-binding protein [Halobacteria archaeon]
MQNKQNVIDVKDVSHSFDELSVLEDVSFGIKPGEMTAIVGPNGSGKTTLLRIVAGTGNLSPSAGTVELDTRVGYLPQQPRFRSAFTVKETLDFYAGLLDENVDTEVESAISRVGLGDVRHRRVNELSGGMVRLLGISQAMLGDPEVVLLDEPTGDLDPRVTSHIFDVVRELADEGTAVLLATHNMMGARKSDRVLVLDRGRIVEDESPDGLMETTCTENMTQSLISVVGDEISVRGSAGGERKKGETEES